ncbi:uncharacterized protein LOC126366028 [Pectinophora gossypiella]|uniref:uncharacterized protein LOC126366028 n=1 Tax=Pectinophora gossypiella TaxID=13191 RepID=UPI00214E1A96|nr:uncharacterized protein LOC126366028 [Pectinophora gossypiella]
MMESLLISRLQDIINHIEIVTKQCETFLQKEISDIDKQQAEIATKKLENLHSRFSTELNNYFRLSIEPSADDISMFSAIQLNSEEILIELTIKLKDLREDRSERSNKATYSELPKLNLPEFSGDVLQWQQFWDHFTSNIDSRHLPDVDKLLYLKASLSGDAKRAVEGLETTNRNYEIAVSILKERYGKEHYIIDAHYAALYKIKAADKTAEDCRRTLNEVERHLRVLNSLGENTNHNHLRFIIIEKFPEEIVYELKMLLKTDSIEDMRKQLEIIISAREDANRIAQEKSQKEIRHYTVETFHGTDSVNQHNPSSGSRRFKIQERFKNLKDKHQDWKMKMRFAPNYKNNNYNNNRMLPNKRKFENSYEKDINMKKPRLNCIFCSGAHYNDQCKTVRTIKDRQIKLKGRCFYCFVQGHWSKTCKINKKCIHCGGRHNRALCPKVCDSVKVKTLHTNTSVKSGNSTTALQTAVVTVLNENKCDKVNCRILMDSGSQRSYVTKRIATELNLAVIEEHHLSVFTFGTDQPLEYDSPLVKLNILTRTNEEVVLYANVVPTIAQHVSYPGEELYHWKNECILADDGSLGDQVDILIGNDYYFTVIDTTKKRITENLFLVDSKFGWMLTGKTEKKNIDNLSVITYFQSNKETKLNKPDLPLDNMHLKNLWDLECIGITDSPNTTKEEEAMKNFNDNTKYKDKRYFVCWPWNNNVSTLPTNLGLVTGRLINLLRRMDKDTLKLYDETIRNQLEDGIIEAVPSDEIDHSIHTIHYLPHHGVKTPGKAVRIVYDASAKLKQGVSLNECLRAGPVLLEDLTGLLIRFRSHKTAITADVEKAFLQIGLQDDSKDVTRFLWLKDITKAATDDNIIHLRFCRVPFGVISSPFLLNATIKYHLMQSANKAVQQVSGDIYVDNLVTGTKTTLQAITLYNNLKREFEKITMNLREWSSNSKEFKEKIPDVLDKEVVKVLGLDWNTNKDTIQLRPNNVDLQTTKRGVLRTIASTYDPCGFVAPSLLSPKLFMQDLWKSKIKWDSKLPKELFEEWRNIYNNLETEQEEIPRYYTKDFESKENQLHCFTDASTKAYAAVVCIVNENGKECS